MLPSIESAFCGRSVSRPVWDNKQAENDAQRFNLVLTKRSGQGLVLRIFDRERGCFFLDWHGAVVTHLRDSGALPTALMQAGYCHCDKSTIWHLILAGAVIQRTLDQLGDPQHYERRNTQEVQANWPAHMPSVNHERQQPQAESLCGRMARLGLQLAGPHKLVARLLFARPGQHFSEDDVACLFMLECPSLVFGEGRLTTCLDELARWQVIQRIEVDRDNIFYDINTAPHLHVFNSSTRELRDANVHGILHVDAAASNASVEIVGNSNIVIGT